MGGMALKWKKFNLELGQKEFHMLKSDRTIERSIRIDDQIIISTINPEYINGINL